MITFDRTEEFTCSELISRDVEGLHLNLEDVDGQIRSHVQSLLLAAHVRVSQGASQVVQAAVNGRDGLCIRGQRQDMT